MLAECVFVLESHYRHPRSDIARTLAALIASPGVEIDALSVQIDALERYAQTKLHFIDCTIAATAVTRGLPVATFDAGLTKLRDIVVNLQT